MLKKELGLVLQRQGAALWGVGDIRDVTVDAAFPTGVSAAIPLSKKITADLLQGPTVAYKEAYREINQRLNAVVEEGAEFLRRQGWQAKALTTDVVERDEQWCTPLPYKSVALRAGLGWIGKNGLLITPQYGGAVRLSCLITNAPLQPDEPIWESRCGECSACVEACPAGALTGAIWSRGVSREELFHREPCKKMQRQRMRECTGVEAELCGLCFAVCPYSRQYAQEE